uniref:Uncharacterized protein n=1 Tax=Arundo donax TaxID=35708 RepID=A0A0A9F5H0_ARUDO
MNGKVRFVTRSYSFPFDVCFLWFPDFNLLTRGSTFFLHSGWTMYTVNLLRGIDLAI